MGYESTYTTGGYLFVSEDYAQITDRENLMRGGLYINAKNSIETENKLNDLKKEDEKFDEILVENIALIAEQQKRIIILISIFLYGFIAVITLIGVTNIFNTITTNMILRSKEFANLKSIGMTTKEFNKMTINRNSNRTYRFIRNIQIIYKFNRFWLYSTMASNNNFYNICIYNSRTNNEIFVK